MANVVLCVVALVVFAVLAGDLVVEERRRRRSLKAYFARRG